MLKLVLALALVSCVCAFGASSGAYPLIEKDHKYMYGDVELSGYLMYQDMPDSLPRPGLLALPYFMGAPALVNRDIARMYAEKGMVVFMADYYGKNYSDANIDDFKAALTGDYFSFIGDRPKMRETAMLAYEQLMSVDMVDPENIAVIGFCFGGSMAGELARAGAKAKVMISMHGEVGPADDAWSPEDYKVDYFASFFGRKDPLIPTEKVEAGNAWLDELAAEYSTTVYGKDVHGFSHIMSDTVYEGFASIGYGGAAAYNPDTAELAWAAAGALLKKHGLI